MAILSVASAGVIPLAAPAALLAPGHATVIAQPLAARTVVAGPSGTVVSHAGVPLALSAHVW